MSIKLTSRRKFFLDNMETNTLVRMGEGGNGVGEDYKGKGLY